MTRIIAGSRKGHRLRTPDHSNTRPTSDRVREAAFSAIGDWAGRVGEPPEQMLSGLGVLDLYAGSGAVGLEAASRGASPVYAVESQSSVSSLAQQNARHTNLTVKVVTAKVEKWVAAGATTAFDVVWADPPYALANSAVSEMLAQLVESGWIKPDGLLVLERSSRDAPPHLPGSLSQAWHRRYGETILYFATKDQQC